MVQYIVFFIYPKIAPQDYNEGFQEFITNINLEINEIDLVLRLVNDEMTGDIMLLLVHDKINDNNNNNSYKEQSTNNL